MAGGQNPYILASYAPAANRVAAVFVGGDGRRQGKLFNIESHDGSD